MSRWVDLSDKSVLERQQIFKACLDKACYQSQERAEKVAERRTKEQPGLQLGIYICRFCNLFHLTSHAGDGCVRVIGEKLGDRCIT